MAFNPFLINQTDSSSANETGGFSNFNPFAVSDNEQQPNNTSNNPFFELAASTTSNTALNKDEASAAFQSNIGDSTNPFAAFFISQASSSTTANEIRLTSDTDRVIGQSSNVDLLGDVFGSGSSYETLKIDPKPMAKDAPSLRTNIDIRRQSLDTTTDITRFNADARRKSDVLWSNMELEKRERKIPPTRPEPPRRPPPPRPSPPAAPPPSKETKDLILSVTGALEATSSDLLDRLQATRTPSPTPISELHSPSPIHMNENDNFLTEASTDDASFILPEKTMHGEDIFGELASTISTQDPFATTPFELSQQEDFDVFHAIANLPKAEDIDEQLKQQQQPKVPIPPRPPPPAPIESRQPVVLNDFFDTVTPAETVHNVTPFDTSKPFPGQTSIFQQIDENDSQTVLEALSRKSSLLSGPSSSPPELETYPPTTSPTMSSIFSSMENVTKLTASSTFQKPTELSVISSDDKYSRARKASHDITAEKIQIIPSRKKYSLDYSSSSAVGASGFFQGTRVADDKILEVPKFPAGMSTTPIISCENIANEALFEEPDEARRQQSNDDIFSATCSGVVAKYDIFSQPSELSQDQTQREMITVTDPFADDLLSKSVVIGSGIPQKKPDDFDAFEAKFESFKADTTASIKSGDPFDPFSSGGTDLLIGVADDSATSTGFGNEEPFDEFLAMQQPLSTVTTEAAKPFTSDAWPGEQQAVMMESSARAYQEAAATSKVNFFENLQDNVIPKEQLNLKLQTEVGKVQRQESEETPPTPLFDEDVSQPLESFPRTIYEGPGWEMQIRYPIRKKFTGQRFWKKVFVRLLYQGDTPHLELLNRDDGKETILHEWPLQPCYAISEIGAQQYDQYGKIFTIKIQFVVYKERPGVRPGQVTKAERLTNKLSQFAAYAIQGDYQGVKEFGSDLKKLGLPVEHSPQISLICKLGSHSYEDMKQFSSCVEEALFRLPAHRDNIHINYKMEEVQITAVDELYVEQNSKGAVNKQIARVRLFFLGFLTGMPDIDVGINDLWRQGKEVVGRHDIIPVVTEEWIRLENIEFHSCVQQEIYEEARTIRFKPPDACYFELMRFRVRPPKNRELPVQLKTTFRINGNKVDIYADIIVPGFTSRKLGQIPCEDVVVRIPIPECWIYLFRVEKHFRYGSVKSAHRRTGKIKGIERFLGAVENLEPHLIEVTSGHAKYEHHHRSIVWRMSRLPKEGQGAYTTHNLACHLALTSFDQIPDELAKYCYVEFTMPIAQVSHTTVRSVSITNSDSDNPPEKCVRHLARHEYRVEIEHTHSEEMADYVAATIRKPLPKVLEKDRPPSTDPEQQNSDSDSSG